MRAFGTALALFAVACSTPESDGAFSGHGDAGSENAGMAGSGASGGASGGSGARDDGGSPAVGGARDDGGSPGVGGAHDDGGSPAVGGARDDGGAPGLGGATGDAGASTGEDAAYAHVTAVSASGTDGAYTFSVSIESADIDCSQFADFWEVLSEDGSLLYRRILEHSHTDENGTTDPDAPGNTFTRDGGPVSITPASVVIVRAHMSTTGYNGRALRGSVETGFADAPDIDATFAASVEDDPPVPVGCLF